MLGKVGYPANQLLFQVIRNLQLICQLAEHMISFLQFLAYFFNIITNFLFNFSFSSLGVFLIETGRFFAGCK